MGSLNTDDDRKNVLWLYLLVEVSLTRSSPRDTITDADFLRLFNPPLFMLLICYPYPFFPFGSFPLSSLPA